MILICLQLEQALGVSETDVKDASAGVMQDLKRFQKEKEGDLRRYMVSTPCLKSWHMANHDIRSPMHAVTLTGRGRISRPGQRQRTKWTRSSLGRRRIMYNSPWWLNLSHNTLAS